jgi:hypothetical protein
MKDQLHVHGHLRSLMTPQRCSYCLSAIANGCALLNSIERKNEEIHRRERVIRIFPNHASAERLIGALLMEQDEI